MSGRRPYYVGADPVPALGSGLAVVAAEDCGIGAGSGRLSAFPAPTRSGRSLLQLPEVGELLAGAAAGVVLWTGSAAAERRLLELGVRAANSPAGVARRLENKARFPALAAARGIPVPAYVDGPAGPELVRRARPLGLPLVFQPARGFSGASTHPIFEPGELESLCDELRGHPARVSRLVAGTPVTVTGVVLPSRVVLGGPCLQLTGLEELTPYPMGSCGNDFSAPIPEPELVRRIALDVGTLLRAEGHLGIFGVDLVVGGDGSAWCIEANPRLVASVPLWSLSARTGGASLVNLHLAAFGLADEDRGTPECHWSQLILYQRGERAEMVPPPSRLGRLDSESGFVAGTELTLEGPPEGAAAEVIRPGGVRGRELARLMLMGPLTVPGGGLLPHLSAWARSLREKLEGASPP